MKHQVSTIIITLQGEQGDDEHLHSRHAAPGERGRIEQRHKQNNHIYPDFYTVVFEPSGVSVSLSDEDLADTARYTIEAPA